MMRLRVKWLNLRLRMQPTKCYECGGPLPAIRAGGIPKGYCSPGCYDEFRAFMQEI